MSASGPQSAPRPPLPPVMTLEQAARHLGVGTDALRRPDGPRTLNVLGDMLVLRTDLEGWLAGRPAARG